MREDLDLGHLCAPGRSGWVVIGKGGAGKTAALRAIAAASGSSKPTRWIRGGRLATSEPYESLEAVLPFDVLEKLLEGGTRLARLKAQRALLGGLETDGILVVDDAQWLDPETLGLLAGLAESRESLGLEMVVGHRPRLDRNHLAHLDSILTFGHPAVVLGHLDDESARRYVASGPLGGLGPVAVDHAVGRCGGVTGLIDLLADSCDTDSSAHEAWVGGSAAPPHVTEGVRSKVSLLSQGARELLLAMCFGASPNDDLVEQLDGVADHRALGAAMFEIDDEGFLDADGAEPVPLIAVVVPELQPPTERSRYHLTVASALSGRSDAVVARAEHLLAGGEHSALAVDVFLAACDHLVDDAPDLAAEWLERAESGGADRLEVATRRVVVNVRQGRPLEAIRAAGPLFQDGNRVDELFAVANAYVDARRPSQAAGALMPMLAGRPGDVGDIAHMSAGLCRVIAGSLDDDYDIVTAALGSRPLADPQAEVARLVAVSVCLLGTGEWIASLASAADASALELAVLREQRLPFSANSFATWLGLYVGDLGYSRRICDRALAAPSRTDAIRRSRVLRSELVSVLGGAVKTSIDPLADWSDLGPVDRLVSVAVAAGAARRSNDISRLHQLRPLLHEVLLQPPDLLGLAAYGEVMAGVARVGDLDVADAACVARDRAMEFCVQQPVQVLLAWIDLQVTIAADRRERLPALVDRLESIGPLEGRPGELVAAMKVWCSSLHGSVDAQAVTTAGGALRNLGYRWEATRIVGTAAMHIDDQAAAKNLLAAAREMRADLRASDAAHAPLSAKLSEREMEVAALISDGNTHKQVGAKLFISPKTVEHHVARIRQRLGVSSRAEMLELIRVELETAK
ncbi:MAG: hypothetical protein GY708_20450 [Actinomycetia bacterium]|nr:hypothetical protein [Actinomycetes bacterium]